jgi:FkbM family methyltransferase
MPWAESFLQRVKGRRRGAGLMRAAYWLALMLWKVARRVPGVNRVCGQMSVDGHRLRVRLFSYDDLLTVSEEYERCLAELMPPPGGVAVDAGAFIGRHALAYARAVGRAGRVVAVEPLAANFRLLEANVRLNGYEQVRCLRCALGSKTGEAWLAYERETSTASMMRDLPHRERVAQRTLDDLLAELGIAQIDVLKIDVEGAELDVLAGSTRTLAASPQVRLVIEVHGPLDAAGVCPVECWLAARGFAVRRLYEQRRRFCVAQAAKTEPH